MRVHDIYVNNYESNLKRMAFLTKLMTFTRRENRVRWRSENTLTLFRSQIKALRKRMGMNQGGMAMNLGVSQSRYSDIENGTEDLSLSTIRRIAEIFDCHVEVRLVSFRESLSQYNNPDPPIPPYHSAEISGCEGELEIIQDAVRLGRQELTSRGHLDSVGVPIEKTLAEDDKNFLKNPLRAMRVESGGDDSGGSDV